MEAPSQIFNYFIMLLDNYITQNQLIRDFGWSTGMIKDFMPNPCRRTANHINPRFKKTKWYHINRINRIANTQEFHERFVKKIMRSRRAKNGWIKRFN